MTSQRPEPIDSERASLDDVLTRLTALVEGDDFVNIDAFVDALADALAEAIDEARARGDAEGRAA